MQSRPAATRYRLRPDESGYDNLVLAGDWTDNGLNAGCIEAATISGLQAANARAGPLTRLPDHRSASQLRGGAANGCRTHPRRRHAEPGGTRPPGGGRALPFERHPIATVSVELDECLGFSASPTVTGIS